MPNVYILSDHGKLTKKGETLQLTATDGTITTIFPFQTDHLAIKGNVEITGSAFKLLMRNKIDTVFISSNGRFNGKIAFQEGKNVFLRKRQYEILDSPGDLLEIAKSVVCGKLRNQLAFMQRIKRRRDIDKELDGAVSLMKDSIESSARAESIQSLRGHEGIGARSYFSVFQHNIFQDWAVFRGRTMHPPTDNVNAVLSFLYTLLYYRVDAAIEEKGLDNHVGYLHALDYGRPSLSFDLMEEWRTPLADTLCCALMNLGTLGQGDFEEKTFSVDNDEYPLDQDKADVTPTGPVSITEKHGVLLTIDGLKKAITQFEKKLDTVFHYPPLDRQVSYEVAIGEQIRHFKRVLLREEKTYKPVALR